MTKEVQKPPSPRPDGPVKVPRRSAVLAALSLLGASMGLSLNEATAGDVGVCGKAKTADKAFSDMERKGYVSGAKPPGSTGPTRPPTPTTGSKNQK